MGAHPKWNLVQVCRQDFPFVILGLNLQGYEQFTEFTQISAPVTEKKIFGKLLGNG